MDSGGEIVAVLFMVIVMPLWMSLHYVTKWKNNKGNISADDENNLNRLRKSADKMEERLNSMERILDEEVPGWRHKHHDHL